MRWIGVAFAAFLLGGGAGWALFGGPLSPEQKAERRLAEHRRTQGIDDSKARCHEREGGDFRCEVWEPVDDVRTDGYADFIVRPRERGRWVFDELRD